MQAARKREFNFGKEVEMKRQDKTERDGKEDIPGWLTSFSFLFPGIFRLSWSSFSRDISWEQNISRRDKSWRQGKKKQFLFKCFDSILSFPCLLPLEDVCKTWSGTHTSGNKTHCLVWVNVLVSLCCCKNFYSHSIETTSKIIIMILHLFLNLASSLNWTAHDINITRTNYLCWTQGLSKTTRNKPFEREIHINY